MSAFACGDKEMLTLMKIMKKMKYQANNERKKSNNNEIKGIEFTSSRVMNVSVSNE